MSTKTNFKRIALVAVAALGLGVLSSAPSQATFTGLSTAPLTLSTTNGTAGLTGAVTDSTTAGTFTLSALSNVVTDSVAVSSVLKTKPAGASSANPALVFMLNDTGTSSAMPLIAVKDYPASTIRVARVLVGNSAADTSTEFSIAPAASQAIGYVVGTWKVFMDSNTASTTRVAGTYTYTIIATSSAPAVTQTVDISFTVTAAASDSVVIAPGSSSAFIGTATAATSDAVISALATASTTPAAYVRVVTKNANGDAKPESITATISGAGLLSFGGISGTSLTVAGTGGSDISVLPDGRAGTATITISTPTRSFPAKTMSFYAVAPATLVATVSAPLAVVGTNSDVVRVTATDSAGISWGGTLYIYASSATDAAIAGAVRATAASSAIACAVPTATQPAHVCPVSGIAAGTAKFKVSNYSTAALATAAASGAEVTSNEVSVVVSTATVATVKIEFDKASYAPGERARIYVTPLDSTGKALPAGTYTNLFATGGISTASALTFAGSTTTADSLTAVSITTSATSSSTSGARAGSMQYTVYMPVSGATVTLSATGGTSLPIAGRVAVTGTATVTDSGAAALAAVTALATTVASLKTLITTLTNLVLKIQKKVKA